ncbi:MAG: hypothetical protein M0P95_16745 [Sulfuritalea sp.]|jgi:hypothetical protein|nr:hypothetical protein [Sulfuritalea sp.]
MSFRYICPYCHVPIDPAAMELSSCECADLRVCPNCDSPVVLAMHSGHERCCAAPRASSTQSSLDVESGRAGRFDPREATA